MSTTVIYTQLGLNAIAINKTAYELALASATADARAYANSAVSAAQAAQSDAAFAASSMANLGMTAAIIGQAAYDALLPAYTVYLASVGVANRGVVVHQLATIVAGLTTDATYGTAAKNLVAAYDSALAYSIASTSTLDKIISVIPTPLAFTLTANADAATGTSGNDVINGTLLNSLTATDLILDASTTDKDVLDIAVNRAAAATIANIEAVNYKWTANSDLAIDATNVSGSTLNLTGSALAFSGAATVTAAGGNNVNADATVTGTLTVGDIKSSTINAAKASAIALDAAAATTVGEKMAATVVVNGTLTTTNGAQTLDTLTLQMASATAVTATVALPTDSLTVTGAGDLTVKAAVTGATIKNSLTSGTLTVNATDTGVVNLSKVSANTIQLSAAATDVTVVTGQSVAVKTGGTIETLKSTSGTAAVTLATDIGITKLDVTAIGDLTLVASKDATIGSLTVDAVNNTVISGAGNLTITKAITTESISIDATALTGKLTVTADSDKTIALVGSATAANTVDVTKAVAATSKVVLITGSAADTITLGKHTGSVSVNTGAGDDTVNVTLDMTGTTSLTGGDGKDTLIVSDAIGLASVAGVSKVSFTGFEVLDLLTETNVNNVQISGSTATVSNKTEAAGNANLNVFVYDKSGVATTSVTDLSGLTFDATIGQNFKTVAVTGSAVADTIKGTKLADTITGGKGADVIDISQGGADTIVVADGEATGTKYDTVSGFTASATASANDTIKFTAVTVPVNVAGTDVKSAMTGGAGSEVITASITSGLMTLAGANAASIDTLAEWVKAASIMANGAAGDTVGFKFNGNTYVVNSGATVGATTTFADDVVVELTGLTTATKVGVAAAADTILIAAI